MSHATTACLLFLTGAGIALAPPAEAVSPATASGSFHLPAPCARALPYFTALGEKAWAQGWKPRLLSGATQRGSVFVDISMYILIAALGDEERMWYTEYMRVEHEVDTQMGNDIQQELVS